MPFTISTQGSFTSTGAGVQIPLPSSADYFKVYNMTQLAANPNPGVSVMFEWWGESAGAGASPAGGALAWTKTNSSNAMNADIITSGGFTYVTSAPVVEAAVTGGTAITAATPAVVSITNTYSNGDRVRLYNTTGMLQIAGMDFTISSVSGSGFTLLGLPAAGFAAAATAVTARRISQNNAVEPKFLFVTAISQATSAVVTVSTAHSYVVGMKVHFSVPSSFGMSQMDQLTGTITAVGTYTITVDIDSSAFTAFAFPASSGSPTASLFATVAPAGQSTQQNQQTLVQTGYNFTYAPFHTGTFTPYMYLPGGSASPAGANADVIVWQAYKFEN